MARVEDELFAFGLSPSINDRGHVAFVGVFQTAILPLEVRPGVFVVDASGQRTNVTPEFGAPIGTVAGVEINNNNEILTYTSNGVSQSGALLQLGTHLDKWDGTGLDAYLSMQAAASWSSDDPLGERTPEWFQYIGEWPTLNNVGQVAFFAAEAPTSISGSTAFDAGDIIADELFLAMPVGADFEEGHHTWTIESSRAFELANTLAPKLADDGRIVLRAGFDPDSPIQVINFQAFSPERIAGTEEGFTRLGSKPGISDDGKAVAFLGDRGDGPGLFLAIDQADGSFGTFPLLRVAGENAGTEKHPELGFGPVVTDPISGDPFPQPLYFQDFDFASRVDIEHVEKPPEGFAGDSVIIAFMGRPNGSSRVNPAAPGTRLSFSAAEGLWTVRVDFEELPDGGGLVGHPRSALPVAQVGDILHGAPIATIHIYDPLAVALVDDEQAPRGRGDHRVVFGAQTSLGPIIARASHLDTDADGLLDHWETSGIDMDGDGGIDLDLRAMGANPSHKDIFLEIDWLVPRTSGSVRPWRNELQPGVTERLVEMFHNARGVQNPDGRPGIELHIDAGRGRDPVRGRPFSQNMPDDPSFLQGGDGVHPAGLPTQHIDVLQLSDVNTSIAGVHTASFSSMKDLFFGTTDKRARELAFDYAILADFHSFIPSGRPFVSTAESATDESIVSSTDLPQPREGDLSDQFIMIASGTGQGQIRRILSQSGNELTVTPWATRPDRDATFVLLDGSGGEAELAFFSDDTTLPGNDSVTTLGGSGVANGVLGSRLDQWKTLAHELGHNLGLRHCGVNPDAEACDDANVGSGISILQDRDELIVVEGSLTDSYEIVLKSIPTAPVTVESVDNFEQVRTVPSRVTFEPGDWDIPRTVTVEALVDDVRDTRRPGSAWHEGRLRHEISSDDQRFDGSSAPLVPVRVYDAQHPALVVLDGADLTAVEGGRGDSYQVALSRPPTGDVQVQISADPLVVTPSTLTFTSATSTAGGWDVPQTVSVSAPAGGVFGDQVFLFHVLSSSDPNFNFDDRIGVDVFSDEIPRILLTETGGLTQVVEGASSGDTYTIVLTAEPEQDVTIAISPDRETDVDRDSVTFTPGSWDQPITIAVTAHDDDRVAEGRHTSSISHRVTRSGPDYENASKDLRVFVDDDDFMTERDHRSLMSYAHLEDDLNDYAGPGDPLFNEWSNLKPDFHNTFLHVGSTAPAEEPSLDISLKEYIELFGRVPDVEGPEVALLGAGPGLDIPLSAASAIRFQARDEETLIGEAAVLFDLDGDGAVGPGEDIKATEVAPDVFEAQLPGLSGLLGPRTARIYAEDTRGNYTLETFDVNAVATDENRPPVALDEVVVTEVNTDVAIRLQATDPNGAPLSYLVVSPPVEGVLSGVAPHLTYTPNPDFSGFDSFSFRANDGLADSNLATVTIMVGRVNEPPVLAPIGSQSLDEGESLTIPVSATDPDGDPITLSASGLPGFATFEDRGDGTGALSLDPEADDIGVHPGIKITAADERFEAREILAVTVNAVNEAPVLAPIGDVTGFAVPGTTTRTTVVVSASDPDGDALAFSATGLPSFASFSDTGDQTGELALAPEPTDVGSHPGVTVTVSDGVVEASETFTIHVKGDEGPPRLADVIPRDGATFLEGLTIVYARFDQPLDPATVTASNFRLLDGPGNVVEPLSVELRSSQDVVLLSYAPLPAGEYALEIRAPEVTDRSGNPMGDANLVATRFTLLERSATSSSLFPGRIYPVSSFLGFVHGVVEVGDLDEDGRLDLLVGRSLLFGIGDGTFSKERVLFSPGQVVQGLGDVNNDGHLDVITQPFHEENHFSTRLGNGDGTLREPLESPSFPGFVSLLGDMDGDGNLDVIADDSHRSLTVHNFTVLKGNGDGTFLVHQTRTYAARHPRALGDFNGDDRLDLVVVDSQGSWAVILGTADGGLGALQTLSVSAALLDAAVGDANGDGSLDLFLNTNNPENDQFFAVAVLVNNGDGSFAEPAFYPLTGVSNLLGRSSLLVSDLDGDGHLDFVVPLRRKTVDGRHPRYAHAVVVRLGNGDGSFGDASEYTAADRLLGGGLGDFDGDGDVDIAALSVGSPFANNVCVLLGNGDGTFPVLEEYPVPNPINPGFSDGWVDRGDVDRDGDVDIVAGAREPLIEVLLGNADGTFAEPTELDVRDFQRFGALEDLNGDGNLDLVTANQPDYSISVLLGAGDGSFGAPTRFVDGVGERPRYIAFGDLDGDGDTDMVIAVSTGLSVLLGEGDGTFRGAPAVSTTRPSSVGLGDVDGDGDLDAVFKEFATRFPGTQIAFVGVLPGNGDGTFDVASEEFYLVDAPKGLVALDDLDADGDLDIVSGNAGDVSVLLGNGDGTFGESTEYGAGVAPLTVALGDVDADGHLDIVTGNEGQGSRSFTVLRGAGDGSFSDRTDYFVVGELRALALGDVDRDGRLDVVTANGLSTVEDGGNISVRRSGLGRILRSAPEAEAGEDRLVEAGVVVTLDGTASVNPTPDDPLEFHWIQTSGPEITLSGARSATPTFRPVELGVYRFELTVTAGEVSDTDTIDVTVDGRPDLTVAQSDGESAVLPGDSITYAIAVANAGNAPATGVVVTDALPPHTGFVDASDGGTPAGGVVTWPAFDLPVSQTVTRTVTVRVSDVVPAGLDAITNSVQVADDGALGPDPTPENNVSSDTNQLVAFPNLAISLNDGRSRAVPGETLTYGLTVQNLGNQGATGVLVRYSLPAHSNLVGASDGGALDAGGDVSWPTFALSAGATASRSVTVGLDDVWPAGLEVLESRATVGDDGANGPDPQSANNVAVDADSVLLPDLSVSIDDGKSILVPDQEITYVISIRNTGQEASTGVLVADALPPEAVFVTASDGARLEGNNVLWPTFDLAPGDSTTRSLTVRVADILREDATTLTNTVSVTDDGTHGPDLTPDSNQASDTDRLSRVTDLAVAQTGSPDPVPVGEELTYTIVVTNQGPEPATGVTLSDLLPASVTLNSASTTHGTCRETLPVRCPIGSLQAGESATVTIRVTPTIEGTSSNRVTVEGSQVDANGADNIAFLTITARLLPQWTFVNQAELASVGIIGEKEGGLAWCDFNHDGYLDLLVNTDVDTPEFRSRLLFNRGDGTFVDVTETHANGLTWRKAAFSAVCGDLNDDGYLDFARNDPGRAEVYLNRGPLADPSWSFGISENQLPNRVFPNLPREMNTEGLGLIDFDADADLDLILDNETLGIALIENRGPRQLQHTPENFGLPAVGGAGDNVAVTDYDVDGWVDLLARKEGQFDIWRNVGGSFQANTSFDEQASGANKGGAAFCDVDTDGDFDVVWTDAGETQIWRNDAGDFMPTGEPSQSSEVDLSGDDIDGVACADVDNDGDLDLFFSALGGPSYLFFNESPADFVFQRDNRELFVDGDGEAVAFGDYDRDGDLDLAVNVSGGVNQLWQSELNDEGSNDYLVVRALLCLPNGLYRDDIGATVRLFDAARTTPLSPIREVNGGRGHGSQDPAGIHFGLPGGPDAEYLVEVRFTGDTDTPVQQNVVPSQILGDYQIVEVKNCTVGNDRPVAFDIAARTSWDRQVRVELRGFDPEGHPVTYQLDTRPAHGTVELIGKTLTYTPDAGFVGEDPLTYIVRDDELASPTAEVHIRVVSPEE